MRWLLPMAVAGAFLALPAQSLPQNPSSAAAEPQAKSAPPCRNDRPIEEYIAELNKGKKQRNKSPLPNSVCIGGWCKGTGVGSPDPNDLPTTHPPSPQDPAGGRGQESSSEAASEEAPPYDPIFAAKNVEVGDYYFSQKNYRAALNRYQEALESKPDDPAILLRLARTFEKLDEPVRAFENYDASVVADAAGPSAAEARQGAERLRAELEKRGDDPDAISTRNRARIVPLCRKQAPASPNSPR